MENGIIHRCPRKCPYHKKCFVCKTANKVKGDVVILHKCIVTKEEIPVHIGLYSTIDCAVE